MPSWIYICLSILVAALFLQSRAHANLAPEWKERRATVYRTLPKRSYFTKRGWRYLVAAVGLAIVDIVLLIVLPLGQ